MGFWQNQMPTLFAMWDCTPKAGRTPETVLAGGHMEYSAHHLPMITEDDFWH